MKKKGILPETQHCFQECQRFIERLVAFFGTKISKAPTETFSLAKRLLNRFLFLFLVHQKNPLWLSLENISTAEVYRVWKEIFSKKIGAWDPFPESPLLEEGFLSIPNEMFWSPSSLEPGIFNILGKYSFSLTEDKNVCVTPLLLEKVHEELQDIQKRKASGTFYTPPELVHSMCRLSLMQHFEVKLEQWSERPKSLPPLSNQEWSHIFYPDLFSFPSTLFQQWPELAKVMDQWLEEICVLDLSMGSGAFLVGISEEIVALRSFLTLWLPQTQPFGRALFSLKKATLEKNLYGIDIDSGGIEVCQFRLWLSFLSEAGATLDSIPERSDRRFVCGNALQLLENEISNKEGTPFGDVFYGKGGFDLVLGNPPYLKEREHSDIFHTANISSLGQKYHEGKMDFWFYFLHQAMDMICNTGSICYVTPRYWLNSRGAKKLIQRIQKELRIVHMLDLGNHKTFPGVSGHHLVALYTLGKKKDDFQYQKLVRPLESLNYANLMKIPTVILKNSEVFTATHEIIFNTERFSTSGDTLELGEICHISQGVVEAPDKIHQKDLKHNKKKEQGVFVLTQEEMDGLSLTQAERAICYPYLEPKEIERYSIEPQRKQFLIYADQENKKKIEQHPEFFHLKQHLDCWKSSITSSNKPYGLHRPRTLSHFLQAKLIFKNMFIQNKCAYDEQGYMVGLSACILVKNDPETDLKYILAILNSSLAGRWFYQYGKYRGSGVDIGVNKLRQFPIKILSRAQQKPVIQKVDEIFSWKRSRQKTEVLEQQLDQIVEGIYSGVFKTVVRTV
ncbi:MAG: TaqI-like C-terminal specificity domain-containing protein [Planctomycetota bacterium]